MQQLQSGQYRLQAIRTGVNHFTVQSGKYQHLFIGRIHRLYPPLDQEGKKAVGQIAALQVYNLTIFREMSRLLRIILLENPTGQGIPGECACREPKKMLS
jgi:hypothetical protein